MDLNKYRLNAYQNASGKKNTASKSNHFVSDPQVQAATDALTHGGLLKVPSPALTLISMIFSPNTRS